MELKNKKLSNIYLKLVGFFIKNGNKNISNAVCYNSLSNASRRLKLKNVFILRRIVRTLGTILELRTVKIRRNLFTVPFPVNTSRRNYLIVKKISKRILENKSSISFEQKLTQEFINLAKFKKFKASIEQTTIFKETVKNKSNVHFRW
jgi:ribosomal protein S7